MKDERTDQGRLLGLALVYAAMRRTADSDAAVSLLRKMNFPEHSRAALRGLKCDFPYDLAYVKGESVLPICGGH